MSTSPAAVAELPQPPVALGNAAGRQDRHGRGRTLVLVQVHQHDRAHVARASGPRPGTRPGGCSRARCRAWLNTGGRADVVAVDLLGLAAVGEHGPQRLHGPGPLVHVFPAVVEDAAVVHHASGRTRSARLARAARRPVPSALMRCRLVTVSDVPAAQHALLAAGRGEHDAAVGQIAGVHVVGPMPVAAGVFAQVVREQAA